MAELMEDKASNACCAALKKKHTKLLEKYSKVEALKNKFRDCTALLQGKYDAIEKENANLKKAFDQLKVETNMWKDEKEKETGIRIDLEDEVSALKEEIELLKRNGNAGSQEANEQLQERLNVADKEIKKLKELLDKERRKAASEKKTVELEKKKADEALKKLEMNKNKVSEAENMANAERRRAEENRLLWEKLKKETDAVKSKLALEKSRSESACKQVEVEKQNTIRERERADLSAAKAEEQRQLADMNLKKAVSEKNRAERERADLAVAKGEEQRQLADMNLKKAMSEKNRADDLHRKFEEASNKAKNLEEKLKGLLRAGKYLEAQPDASNSGRNVELASGICGDMQKNDAVVLMEKMLLEKEQTIIREKNRADSEERVANKQKKVASKYKMKARKHKHRADELSRELESCKPRLEELQTELVKFYSYRMYADNSSLRHNSTIADNDMIKKLKNQLKLEKTLVKHVKKASEVEAIRNSMLHQELVQLKQEFLQFQLRFDILDNSFLNGGEGIQQLGKIGNCNPTRETLFSDDYHGQGQLISGINSGLDPPHRGSNQKMLKSSAINSSSASFSDRPLVGSQEGCTLSVPSAKLGEEISKIKSNVSQLSAKTRICCNEQAVIKADNTTKSSIKEIANKHRIESHEKKRILDAVQSIERLYCKGEKLHQQMSNELSSLHGILEDQKDEPEEGTMEYNSFKDLIKPLKRRKTSSEGTTVTHLQDNEGAKSSLDSDIGLSNALMAASPGGSATMKFNAHIKDGTKDIFATDQCKSQCFDMMVGCDYMKLLDLDNAADENSYRRAIAMPLSPLPPCIELHVDEKLEVDNPQMLLDKSSEKGLESYGEDLELSSSFHGIGSEDNPINAVAHGAICSQPHTNEGSICFLSSTDSVPAFDTDFQQAHVSGGQLRKLDQMGSELKESNLWCEIGIATPSGGPLKHYVVHSNNRDNQSILRILQTIDSCMPHCFSVDSAGTFIQSVMQSLLMAQDISMKEKVCVFFSLVLHGISEAGTKNWSNVLSYDLIQSLDLVASHIFSALTNPVLWRRFVEICDLFELLVLIEDFLLHMKVFVSSDLSPLPQAISGSKIDVVLNGNVIMLYEVVASAPLLVAGGSMLASLCVAVDHVGCICEMSCNILMIQKCDPAVTLAVLHTFAHVCGSKYFTLQHHSSAITVIKAIVMFLEKKHLSANPTSVSPPSVGDLSTVWLCCTDCPFSKGAVPMENVASMLLENLDKLSQSLSWPQDNFEAVNSVFFRGRLPEDRNDNALGFGESDLSRSAYDENLLEFVDSLSLMEIPASFMSLNWTADHIIGPICTFLELHLMEGFSAGIVVLLGQLGRLGVNTKGYDDYCVKKLREWLSAYVCKTWFTKLSLLVQFAMVTSLFALTPATLEEVANDRVEKPAVTNHCIPASFIREWFSLLDSDQQALLRRSSGGPISDPSPV